MKKAKYIWTIAFIVLGAVSLTSCVRNDYYTTDPYNNGGNNNNSNNTTFNEEFNNDNRGWAFSSSPDSSYASVHNGMLEFINYSTQASNTQVVQTNGNFNGWFLIESRIKSDNDMGIIFGNSGNNYEYGYSFIINNGGYFIVYKEGNANSNVTVLKSWTQNSAIRSTWNDVEIEQNNGYWSFRVNGYEVHQMESRPINGTYCGFITLPQTEAFADYLTVSW